MNSLLPLRGAALAAMLLSAPALALAQSANAPANAPASSPAPAAATPAVPAPDAAAQARVEARIKQLYKDLKITKDQDAQWKAFAGVMRSNAQEMDQAAEERNQQFSTMKAPDDLKSYETLAEDHVQHLQKLIPVFQALYSAMSPEQQKIADQVFRGNAQRRAQSAKQ